MLPKNTIALKLAVYAFVGSLVITVVTAATKAYAQQRQDLKTLSLQLDQLQESHVRPLSLALWELDRSQIATLLNGLNALGHIEYAEVSDEESFTVHVGDESLRSRPEASRRYPLTIRINDQERHIGTFYVVGNATRIRGRLLRTMTTSFASNATEIFTVSVVVWLIFYFFFARHLRAIAQYAERIDLKAQQPPLALQRLAWEGGEDDELMQLITSINHMRDNLGLAYQEIRELNDSLERRVRQRTQSLREAQEELVRKDRLATLGQLTATVSHELRNPLAAMRPSLHVIKKRVQQDDQRALNAFGRVERSIQRCDSIIDELLDFTRIQGADRRPMDVDGWLRELLSEQALPPGIRLACDFGIGETIVSIDPDRLQRAVINVFDNACQAMQQEDGGSASHDARLSVSTRVSGDRIELEIVDRGPGIPEEVLPRIFEPLFSTKGFGVGLGLPTVKQIMEQHGGGVEVDTAAGRGTRMVLWFPVAQEPEVVTQG